MNAIEFSIKGELSFFMEKGSTIFCKSLNNI